jgi:hypothetical protein
MPFLYADGDWTPGHATICIISRMLAKPDIFQDLLQSMATFTPNREVSTSFAYFPKNRRGHRKANFSETQVDFLAGKIVFLVRASKIKIAPYS